MTPGKTRQATSALAALLLMAAAATATEPLRVLILSGANNHDWKSTTPVLRQLVEECPRFKVIDVLEDPSQVTAELLNSCDVIASNWSAYPEMAGHQWGEKAERDFVEWMQAGHGFVVFHAASATSQDWPEFQQLVRLTWGIDKTAHGAYHPLKVTVRASDHPITRGMRDFWITDDEKITAWFENMVVITTDVNRRKAILSQLPRAPGVSTLNLAVGVMKQDEAVREAAAEAAARIGQDLATSERDVVKLTMQQVIAVSRNVDTIKLADAVLREAARSVNLALNATVSSPDGLEPDGGSGPDAAAVDGNLATYWDETDDQPLYRFKVSFAKPTKVNTVVIIGHAYQSHSPQDFEVLCDDKVVKSVTDAKYDERTNETQVSFPRCECSSLELKITGYSGRSPGIRELEIYDVDTGREPTSYVPLPAGPRKLSWRKDESSLALLNYSHVVWALHYGRDIAKPYFDPLGLLDGVSLVWNSPPDHPWHHALWFSWKGINGVNYWEEDGGTGRAEGLTEVVSAKISTRDDFSARVELDLAYHKPGEPPALRETRIVTISAPDQQGRYTIDWRSTFQAADQDLLLQGGTAGGGYAGLSVRIAGDTRDWRLIDGDGREDVPGADPLAKNLHGQHARWMDLSLVHVGSGQAAGLAILAHPTSLRHPTQWHCVLEDKIPFGYFSPSPLWSEPYTLKAGGRFILAYRIVVHPQRLSGAELEQCWREFAIKDR